MSSKGATEYHNDSIPNISLINLYFGSTSNLQKDEKLALRAEVKKHAWSFQENLEDGLLTLQSIDEAIDKLQ